MKRVKGSVRQSNMHKVKLVTIEHGRKSQEAKGDLKAEWRCLQLDHREISNILMNILTTAVFRTS